MKESGKERLKSTIYESTLSTADAVPLPRWGRQISSGYAANIYGAMPEGLRWRVSRFGISKHCPPDRE